MEIKRRLEYIEWIESIPRKRDKTKYFSQDDDFFWAELQKGLLYEKLVAKILRDAGIEPIVVPDGDNFRKSIDHSIKYARKSKDLIIKNYNFEVKSRSIEFTSPRDWPKKLKPIHIDTVSSVDSKKFPVAGYIFISQKTGYLMGIPCNTKRHWHVHKGIDRVRNLRDEFYSADTKFFDDEEVLISSLKNLTTKELERV